MPPPSRSPQPQRLQPRCPQLTEVYPLQASAATKPDKPLATHLKNDENVPQAWFARDQRAWPDPKRSTDTQVPGAEGPKPGPQLDRARLQANLSDPDSSR